MVLARAERAGAGWYSYEALDNGETGARDQYQQFHVIHASGDEAGVPGTENATQARRWAITDGFL